MLLGSLTSINFLASCGGMKNCREVVFPCIELYISGANCISVLERLLQISQSIYDVNIGAKFNATLLV